MELNQYPVTSEVDSSFLEKLMTSRRSHFPKHFTGDKISDELVLKLLEYANMAPNHKKTRPWRFLVFKEKGLNNVVDFMKSYYVASTDKDSISQQKLKNFELRKEKTSHIIALILKQDDQKRVPLIEEYAAVSCAIQNIYLSLSVYGLGGYWSTGALTYTDEVREYLKLNEDEAMLGFFYLGVISEALPMTKREPVDSRIKWIEDNV